MKFIYLSIIAIIALSACSVFQNKHPKVSQNSPIPNDSMVVRSGVSLETLQTGHGVYMRKCGECHTHILPEEMTSEDWHVIVPGMAWNSGISPAEEVALMKYIEAAKQTLTPSKNHTE